MFLYSEFDPCGLCYVLWPLLSINIYRAKQRSRSKRANIGFGKPIQQSWQTLCGIVISFQFRGILSEQEHITKVTAQLLFN